MRIDPEVLRVLDHAEITGLGLKLTETLERKLYVQTNKVLVALGGKWSRQAQAHLFEYDPAEAIEQAVLTGVVVDHRRELGFFETPVPVADEVIELADIHEGHTVCEPSAGLGAIVRRLPEWLLKSTEDKSPLTMCEIDNDRRSALLQAGYRGLMFEPDFLKTTWKYDRIVANPPFGGAQRDVQHVRHMWDCLKPRGVLASVMASGITCRDNRRTNELRELIEGYGEITDLPEHSFRESGTDVNTVIVRMQK